MQAYNEYEETGNGFSFDQYRSDLLLDIINYAKHIYFDKQKSWRSIVKRALQQDFSWNTSAKQYIKLYDSTTDVK